jgi:hypothetical protein
MEPNKAFIIKTKLVIKSQEKNDKIWGWVIKYFAYVWVIVTETT